MKHAFWQSTRGPEDIPGASLHYIQDNDEWHEELRQKAEGNDEWLRNIERMAARDGAGYFHPSLGWWMSQAAYEAGETGFGGITRRRIEDDNPGLVIHASKTEAVTAAGYKLSTPSNSAPAR